MKHTSLLSEMYNSRLVESVVDDIFKYAKSVQSKIKKTGKYDFKVKKTSDPDAITLVIGELSIDDGINLSIVPSGKKLYVSFEGNTEDLLVSKLGLSPGGSKVFTLSKLKKGIDNWVKTVS
jgi:hypothetical protein